jgi:hypothetical protein
MGRDHKHETIELLIRVSDHLQSSFFGHSPKASNIFRAEGARRPSDHQQRSVTV